LHRFWSDDLDEFVANVCRRNPGYVGKLYRASLRWEEIKIFKLEDGITPALDWLGIKYTEVPVVNKSPDGPVLGIETRALITRSEGWTMKRFGFTE
jgi:hypothetical protein